jgi:6-phosphogluconolactonase (cycloisomerase 2 family)
MELPGRCGDWLDTATVTAQGLTLPTTRRTRDADFHLAKTADLHMATTADFLMATDRRIDRRISLIVVAYQLRQNS